jgi:hypothetical protein
VARGGNVHAVTRHGVTPLWHAAAGGHMAAVSVLLDVGASPAVQVSVYVCITVIVDHGTHFLPSVRARDGANTHWRWRSRLSSTSFKFRTVLRSLSFFTCLRVMFLTRAYAVRHSSLKGEPLVRETASKTDETILYGPMNASSAPWSSPPSLTALYQLGKALVSKRVSGAAAKQQPAEGQAVPGPPPRLERPHFAH